jgi:rhodanese-related sulfurtransferase
VPVAFLCRSGVRSVAAAELVTAAGFARAYNVAEGFEGPVDGAGHRGGAAGWKAAGLPWRQS